jgi:hypothetical protein
VSLFGRELPLAGLCDAPAKRYYWYLRVLACLGGFAVFDWRRTWNLYLSRRASLAFRRKS